MRPGKYWVHRSGGKVRLWEDGIFECIEIKGPQIRIFAFY